MLAYDPKKYDLAGATVDLLLRAGRDAAGGQFRGQMLENLVGAGRRERESIRLENFEMLPEAWRSLTHQQSLGKLVINDEHFLAIYDRLIVEIVLPFLQARTISTKLRRPEKIKKRDKKRKDNAGKKELRNDDATKASLLAAKASGRESISDNRDAAQSTLLHSLSSDTKTMRDLWLFDENSLGMMQRFRDATAATDQHNKRISSTQQGHEATVGTANTKYASKGGATCSSEVRRDHEECAHTDGPLEVSAGETEFYYQFPPTLRLQPGPSDRIGGRAHTDAEFGHQDGEVNFWLPLTDGIFTGGWAACSGGGGGGGGGGMDCFGCGDGAMLWVESAPGRGDYHPLGAGKALRPGDIAAFHGTLCRHVAAPNRSAYTRASLDFRVGVGRFFDRTWVLNGTKNDHGRKYLKLPLPVQPPPPLNVGGD